MRADGLGLGLFALHFFVPLAQDQFALLQLVLGLLYLLVALCHFFLQFGLLVQKLLFYLYQFVLLNHFRFGFRVSQDGFVLRPQAVPEQPVRAQSSDQEASDAYYYRKCHFVK